MSVRMTFKGNVIVGGNAENVIARQWVTIADSLVSKVLSSSENEIKACAEDLLLASKKQVPVSQWEKIKTSEGKIVATKRREGGNLRDSGQVVKMDEEAGKVGYAVSYDTRRTDPRSAGNNFNYAWIQHETLEYHHEVGKAKFLEDPYNELKNLFNERIAKAVKQGLAEGAKK